jgi:hypothetical protein
MYSYSQFLTTSDRYGIENANEDQIESLARALEYPFEDIVRAIREVGFDSEEVEEYLRDRYNRG